MENGDLGGKECLLSETWVQARPGSWGDPGLWCSPHQLPIRKLFPDASGTRDLSTLSNLAHPFPNLPWEALGHSQFWCDSQFCLQFGCRLETHRKTREGSNEAIHKWWGLRLESTDAHACVSAHARVPASAPAPASAAASAHAPASVPAHVHAQSLPLPMSLSCLCPCLLGFGVQKQRG